MRMNRMGRGDCGPEDGGFGRGTGRGGRGRARKMAAMMAAGFGGPGEGWGFGPGFAGFGGGRGGRGGRRGRMFASGELRLVLLRLIADESRHGYELIKAIEELTGGDYAPSPGVVYPTLSLLVDEGLIEETAGEGSRKAFAATEAGRKELADHAEEAEALLERLKAVAEEKDRHASPPIRRAVGNLFSALRNRAMSGDFDKDTVHAIADILDDAARRIERL